MHQRAKLLLHLPAACDLLAVRRSLRPCATGLEVDVRKDAGRLVVRAWYSLLHVVQRFEFRCSTMHVPG